MERYMNYYVGIDPGFQGFICVIGDSDGLVDKYPMPIRKAKSKGNEMDLESLSQILTDIKDTYRPRQTVIEKLNVLGGGFSKSSSSKLLQGVGQLESYIHCRGWNYINVKPVTWQREIWTEPDKVVTKVKYKKGKRRGQMCDKVDTKATTINAVQRLIPGVDLRKSDRAKIPFDGVADATAMAIYALRYDLGTLINKKKQ